MFERLYTWKSAKMQNSMKSLNYAFLGYIPQLIHFILTYIKRWNPNMNNML